MKNINQSYVYIESIFDIVKVQNGTETLWGIKSRKEFPYNSYITSRYYSTQGQAFIALGIIESIYKPNKDINPSEFEFLIKAINRLISGNDWITE